MPNDFRNFGKWFSGIRRTDQRCATALLPPNYQNPGFFGLPVFPEVASFLERENQPQHETGCRKRDCRLAQTDDLCLPSFTFLKWISVTSSQEHAM